MKKHIAIKNLLESISMTENILPDYMAGRRRGLTDEETEKIARRLISDVYYLLEILGVE